MAETRSTQGDAVILIRVKVVPGASRNAIAGVLGDRLKVRTSAAPEGGKANKAICKLLARALDLKPAQFELHNGHTNPEKTIRIAGCTIEHLGDKLGIDPTAITQRTR